ncbi:MAG: type 1 glutamine amidotransferase [Thermoleophilaceae bacterium]|nr:type 1 glutamine amidotransferase [Thermoleophilaceae bacterium]
MPGKTFLALQHIACEPPAAFEDELRANDLELVRVELDEGESPPDWREFAGLIVMGGPMGAYEEDSHPWLAAEKRLIGEAAHAGHPVWGVCLGAQLLAASLGARVYPGGAPEVGLLPVEVTAEAAADPVFGAAPPSFPTLQWHGDTFDLPPEAVRLAASPAYPNQAFVFRRAYGLQFHLEVSPELAEEWGAVPAYSESLEAILGPGALDRLVADVAAEAGTTLPLARALFRRWLEQVAGVPTGGSQVGEEAIG